jgi:GTPase
VGKSTFLNLAVNQKIAIVSDKPQTTRNRIVGIYHARQTQLIFLDTPGFHKPKHRLNELMLKTTLRTLDEIDVVLYIVEPEPKIGPGDQYILKRLHNVNTPVVLAINKIDLIRKDRLLPVMEAYSTEYNFAEIIPMSALTNENVTDVLTTLAGYLPEGPQYYPDDMVTDQPERFIVAELIREKILQVTREEIPYSIAVIVERMQPREPDGMLEIEATIYVERASHKGILIGKAGQKLKHIGTAARQEIESLWGTRVYLNLWVKVREKWRMRDHYLRMFGYSNTS